MGYKPTFLNENQIQYHIRIRNNFYVYLPDKNKEVKAFWLFNSLKNSYFKYFYKIIRIKSGELYYLSGRRTEDDFLIILLFNNPQDAQYEYQQRWQIEMGGPPRGFKAMKTSGFDIEKTYLQDVERGRKLVLLVMIAFVWCYKVGIYLNQQTPIITKKH